METLLELREIQKSFGANHIHKGVSFKIYPSETVGLLGGSGTGKSVLLRSIIGLEYIDDGSILFKNSRVDHLEEEELYNVRKKVSYSFQSGALFDSSTVFENIAFPLLEHTDLAWDVIAKKVNETLELVDMKGKGDLMPSDISGGMQKRVGMARSMILEPDIILYDEPTAGLDPTNTNNVLNIMKELKKKGISGIFVTHDIPAALKVCDRILIMELGRIAWEGTPEDMVNTDDEVVKKFFFAIKGKG